MYHRMKKIRAAKDYTKQGQGPYFIEFIHIDGGSMRSKLYNDFGHRTESEYLKWKEIL